MSSPYPSGSGRVVAEYGRGKRLLSLEIKKVGKISNKYRTIGFGDNNSRIFSDLGDAVIIHSGLTTTIEGTLMSITVKPQVDRLIVRKEVVAETGRTILHVEAY